LTVTRAQQGTSGLSFPSNATLTRYNVVEPATDGDTIITFTEVNDARHWAIETIPSDGVMTSTDLGIGSYQIGNYHDFAIAPDLSVKHAFIQSGVKTRETPAGRQLTFAHYLSNNDSTEDYGYSPFRNIFYIRRMIGKEQWSLTWKGTDDTNVYPEDLGTPGSGQLLGDFIHHVAINFLPFILCTDKDSTLQGDYMWSILDQNSFETMQKSWRWVGYSLKFIQKF